MDEVRRQVGSGRRGDNRRHTSPFRVWLDAGLILALTVSSAVSLLIVLFPSQASVIFEAIQNHSSLDPDATITGNYLIDGSLATSVDGDSNDAGSGSAAISGVLEDAWDENSSPGAAVRYSLDPSGSPTGRACQRADVEMLPPGASMRIEQIRFLPPGYYKGSIWLRSAGRVPVLVSLGLTDRNCLDKVLVGRAWRRIEIDGFQSNWGKSDLSIEGLRPGTIWIADADLHRTSDSIVAAILIATLVLIAAPIGIIGLRRVMAAASVGSVTVRICGRYGIEPGEEPTKQ